MRTLTQRQKQPRQRGSSSLTKLHIAAPTVSHQVHPILHLQRTFGNQAVQRLLQAIPDDFEAHSHTNEVARFAHDFRRIPGHPKSLASLQAKLRVSSPGDIHEQEADRVSEQVMRMPDSPLQSVCACGGECSGCRGENQGGEHRPLQTRRAHTNGAGTAAVPPMVSQALRSHGQPLDSAARAFFEPRFGHDFSRVRIHTDPKASESARAMDALAYTVAPDIVFGAGQYAPHTTVGRTLLAHELTHVIQREAGGAQMQRKPVAGGACPAREPGETQASVNAPYDIVELSPQQEWVIYGFGVGSSTVDPAKGDIASLVEHIVWRLAQGHFIYVTGQDPVEVLGYSDCHVSKATPNERLRIERAANFCNAYKLSLFDRLGSHKTFNRFISSCRAAPPGEYVASNATKEGRSQNRGVLIRVLPPKAQTSSLAYDDKYGPTEGNCATYLGVEGFLSREYGHNAYCACTHTPDDPHNNCVRKCLQSKMWSFLAANAEDLRSGRFIWCPTVWKHHRECYAECMCDKSFIDYVAFAPLCTVKTGCPITGLTIALFNPCMVSKE
jgi:Domain of unknown function (DUF4157)